MSDFVNNDGSKATWVFGPTNEIRYGYPPSDYEQDVYGKWWQPGVLSPGERRSADSPIPSSMATYAVPFAPSTISITTRIQVRTLPVDLSSQVQVRIRVAPAVPVLGVSTNQVISTLSCIPIPVPAKQSIISILRDKITDKVASFYDSERAMKTLLNFGQDYQAVITNWQFDPRDENRTTLLVKLYQPLPLEVSVNKKLWITREVSPPVIDRLHSIFIPDAPTLLYLRPPNKNISVAGKSGHSISDVTNERLFSSSLFDNILPSDPVLQEWFTFDANSVELNVDYSDYRNFIFFSSAEQRINAFVNKLTEVEQLTDVLLVHSASLSGTGSAHITGSLPYTALQNIASKRMDILRSFDGYERFLYYNSNIPYSASLTTTHYQDELYYNDDATWPKTANVPVPVSLASSWLADQKLIARAYDTVNQDRLVNNFPEYLRSDSESEDFLKFMDMVGHQVDLMKLYIDQMSNIYDRNNDATTGISQDIVWNIAESFGIDLPNQYAIKNLVDYTIGEVATPNAVTYRQVAAETWKRFLHNHILLMKTKGTKSSLRALSNAYGILPSTLQIRESVTPGVAYPTGSYEVYEEQTNAVVFNAGAYIAVPWYTGSLTPQTLEVRFATTQPTAQRLLNTTGNAWNVVVSPLSGSYARIDVRNSANTTVVSSAYLELLSGEYYSVMLRNDVGGVSLTVKRAYHDDLVDESVSVAASGSIPWASSDRVFLGGSGSLAGIANWQSMVDEVRVWGEHLRNDVFDLHVRYPGLYNGNGHSSAKEQLYTRLSFNVARNLGATGTLINESPYARLSANAIVSSIPVAGFTNIPVQPHNMSIVTREVQRFSPNAGGSQFTTNKVIIADPPTLKYLTLADSSDQVPVLSRNTSIVTLAEKQDNPKSINTVGFYFSLTDAINDNIIRSVGNIDLQNLIGDPSDQFASSYTSLQAISDLYWTSYAYDYSPSSFIDFVKNLLDPLFIQARKLLPVRAKMLGGIVHEPHILERSKAPLKPMKLYAGSYGRYENQSVNLQAGVVSDMVSPTGEINTYDTLLHPLETVQPMVAYDDVHGGIDTVSVLVPYATYTTLTTDVAALDATVFQSTMAAYGAPAIVMTDVVNMATTTAMYNEFTNVIAVKQDILSRFGVTSEIQLSPSQLAEFNLLVNRRRNLNVVNINDLYEASKAAVDSVTPSGSGVFELVLPQTNFDNIEAYTYFTHPLGHVGTRQYVQTRRKASALIDRGVWAQGTVYVRDDFVARVDEDGNIEEWVCTTTDSSITSTLAPELDYNNWSRMQYVSSEVVVIKKAVNIGDVVSLVATDSVYTGIVGYHNSHYRFTRDYRLGIIRHQWLGCLQTDQTTPNGRPVVEILPSAGDILVVNNPDAPIQSTNPNAGPILDVQ